MHDAVTGWKDYTNNSYNTSVLGSKMFVFLVSAALLQDVYCIVTFTEC